MTREAMPASLPAVTVSPYPLNVPYLTEIYMQCILQKRMSHAHISRLINISLDYKMIC